MTTKPRQIPQRSKSQAELANENTVLRKGESSFLDRTGVLKVGDGVTPWNELPPFSPDLFSGGGGGGVGLKGDKGDKGDPGTPGLKGDKGDPGDPGANGADGTNGADGVAVANAPLLYDPATKTLSLPDGSITAAKLAFDVATQAELDAHAADLVLHSSGQEVGYSENVTGTAYVLTTVATALAGVAVVVQPSPRPQYIHFSTWVDVTTTAAAATTGTVGVNVVDETATVWGADIVPFESADSIGYAQAKGMIRIPPNTPAHTFSLTANRAGNSSFRANLLNSTPFRTFLAVIAA